MSQLTDSQPAIIRQLLDQSTKQTLSDGTVCHWFAGRISNHQLELLTAEASLLIEQIGHYAKSGEGFEWTAKTSNFEVNGSVKCSFVFNEYKE